MANDELKKSLIQLWCEIRYGCAYVYVRPLVGEWFHRFYFNIYGSRRMWHCVRFWRGAGLKVSVWRPPVCPLN